MTEPSIGDILGAALKARPDVEPTYDMAAVDAFASLIAAHYRLDLEEVEQAIWEIDAQLAADGVEAFGHLFYAPTGVALLAARVAEIILGPDAADTLPVLIPSYH